MMLDKLRKRSEALETVLRGGVEIEEETEEAEARAQIVFNWLVAEKERADGVLAEYEVLV